MTTSTPEQADLPIVAPTPRQGPAIFHQFGRPQSAPPVASVAPAAVEQAPLAPPGPTGPVAPPKRAVVLAPPNVEADCFVGTKWKGRVGSSAEYEAVITMAPFDTTHNGVPVRRIGVRIHSGDHPWRNTTPMLAKFLGEMGRCGVGEQDVDVRRAERIAKADIVVLGQRRQDLHEDEGVVGTSVQVIGSRAPGGTTEWRLLEVAQVDGAWAVPAATVPEWHSDDYVRDHWPRVTARGMVSPLYEATPQPTATSVGDHGVATGQIRSGTADVGTVIRVMVGEAADPAARNAPAFTVTAGWPSVVDRAGWHEFLTAVEIAYYWPTVLKSGPLHTVMDPTVALADDESVVPAVAMDFAVRFPVTARPAEMPATPVVTSIAPAAKRTPCPAVIKTAIVNHLGQRNGHNVADAVVAVAEAIGATAADVLMWADDLIDRGEIHVSYTNGATRWFLGATPRATATQIENAILAIFDNVVVVVGRDAIRSLRDNIAADPIDTIRVAEHMGAAGKIHAYFEADSTVERWKIGPAPAGPAGTIEKRGTGFGLTWGDVRVTGDNEVALAHALLGAVDGKWVAGVTTDDATPLRYALTWPGKGFTVTGKNIAELAENLYARAVTDGRTLAAAHHGASPLLSASEPPYCADVVLLDVGANPIAVLKALRELTGISIHEAKEIIDASKLRPTPAATVDVQATATRYSDALAAAGASVATRISEPGHAADRALLSMVDETTRGRLTTLAKSFQADCRAMLGVTAPRPTIAAVVARLAADARGFIGTRHGGT